jgi:hypothetical protein
VESYDISLLAFARFGVRFWLRLKRSVVEFPRPAFLFWGTAGEIFAPLVEKSEE